MTTKLVQIEKPIYGGAFLGRVEGKAVFVPLTLPGEEARVRIVEAKRGYDTAEVEDVVTVSAERVEPRCAHFGACGGCNYQHADYAAQLRFKQAILRETLERAGVRPPEQINVLAGDPWSSRNRIRLALDGAGSPGYRGRRSREVIPIRECPIAAPLLTRAAFAFAEVARATAPSLRPAELSLFCGPEERELWTTVFVEKAAKVPVDVIGKAFSACVPELRGLEFVVEREGQAPRTIAHWGAGFVHYDAAGFRYRVDHGSFFQVNRWLIDGLVERVSGDARGTLAWDLYAGVGLFARKLAVSFEHVVAVESAPEAIAALTENLRDTKAEPCKSETLAFLRRQSPNNPPGLIVVDPPRTGLGAETTAQLARIAASEIVYVSCDPATLARDLRALIDARYTINDITLVDLFPQTFHLETVVRLRR
jgi:23S rRNA (uracil1939-C5)-methyltransferase